MTSYCPQPKPDPSRLVLLAGETLESRLEREQKQRVQALKKRKKRKPRMPFEGNDA